MKNPARNVSRGFDRHVGREDAAEKAARNPDILSNNIGLDIAARLQDHAARIDPSQDASMNVQIGLGFQQAPCHDPGAQMRRAQFRMITVRLAVWTAGKCKH